MANHFDLDGIGIFGIIGGLAAVGYAIWQSNKVSKACERINMSIDDVEKRTNVDVQEEIVHAAIEKAVERKVDCATNEAVKDVKSDMHHTIAAEVSKAVEEQYNRITDDVFTKVTAEIESISKEKIADTIRTKLQPELKKYGENKIDQMVGDVRDTAMKNLSTNLDYASGAAKIFKEFAFGNNSNSGNNPRVITF